MENYHKSVQYICLLNQLYLEPEIIKKIRYYCNFAVDITGYRNRDLIRLITKDNTERYHLSQSKHRRELIRLLYQKKIHIKPNRNVYQKLNRFDNIVSTLLCEYQIQESLYDEKPSNISFIAKFYQTITGNVDKHTTIEEGKTINYFNYEIDIIQISIHQVGIIATKYFSKHYISGFITLRMNDFLFMIFHIMIPSHLYKCVKYNELKTYLKEVRSFSNETYVNEKLRYDCCNEAFEYIDFCLLKYGKLTYT